MRFTDFLVSVVSVSELPMQQEKYSEGKQEQYCDKKHLDVSILQPVLEVSEVGVNTQTSHTHIQTKSIQCYFILAIWYCSVAWLLT